MKIDCIFRASLTLLFIISLHAVAINHVIVEPRPFIPTNAEMFEWSKDIVDITEKYPQFRRMGTAGDAPVRKYIVAKLKSFGFPDVQEQAYKLKYRQYDNWKLVVEGETLPAYFMRGSGFTDKVKMKNKSVTGELVYVGESISPHDDFTGKIVVFYIRSQHIASKDMKSVSDFIYDPKGSLIKTPLGGKTGWAPANFPISYYQVAKQGAVAMIGILKDFDSGTNKFYPDARASVKARIPGLFMGKYDGAALVRRINTSRDPLQATMTVTGQVKQSSSANVVAVLNGLKKDTIIINTHHDAGWVGAVQDASGVAAVLGLAKYFSDVPAQFRQKTLVFVFDGSHYDWNYPMGANIFAEQNPDIIESTVLTIGIEHIAKRFKVEKDQGFVDTNAIEPRLLFTPPNKLLFEATKQAITSNKLHDTIIPKPDAIPMFGETQGFFLNGIPSYSYIAVPEYLFLSDDTLDKIANDQFQPVIKTFIDIINSVMPIPGSWIKRIDR